MGKIKNLLERIGFKGNNYHAEYKIVARNYKALAKKYGEMPVLSQEVKRAEIKNVIDYLQSTETLPDEYTFTGFFNLLFKENSDLLSVYVGFLEAFNIAKFLEDGEMEILEEFDEDKEQEIRDLISYGKATKEQIQCYHRLEGQIFMYNILRRQKEVDRVTL